MRGRNTLLLSATDGSPDVVAVAATCASDAPPEQVLNLPGVQGSNAFAVTALNVGAAGQITVVPTTGTLALPVHLSLCQTDPQTGQCLQLPPTTSVDLQMGTGAIATFTVFVQGKAQTGYDPARRIFVEFRDATEQTRGEVSVPVRTHSPSCAG